jgi:hypothetical protein
MPRFRTGALVTRSHYVGDEIPLGKRTLRIIGTRDDDAEQPPVLVVEKVER